METMTKSQAAHLEALKTHGSLYRFGHTFKKSLESAQTIKGLSIRVMFKLVSMGLISHKPLIVFKDGSVLEWHEGDGYPPGQWESASLFQAK